MEKIQRLINIKKAASLLGVTPLTLRNWDKADKLKPLRHPINNYRVYRMEDVEALLARIESNTEAAKTTYGRKIRKLQVRHND